MRKNLLLTAACALACGVLLCGTSSLPADEVSRNEKTAAVSETLPVPDLSPTDADCCHPPLLDRGLAGEVALRIAAECRTGTLLFSRGDCLAVRIYTGSGYTHVATIVMVDGQPMVYDSMNGTGVRKLTLEDYLVVQAPDEVHLFHPAREFTEAESREFQYLLDSELGRPYSVKHHLTGRRCEGLHCSEYITDVLVGIDWLRAENPVKVSPAGLQQGILTHHVYTTGTVVALPRPVPTQAAPTGWCGWLWYETKTCTAGTCRQLSRWILCR